MSFNFYEIAEEWSSAIGEGTPNTRNKKHMDILKEILETHIDDTELIESMLDNLKDSHLNKTWDIRRQFSDDN